MSIPLAWPAIGLTLGVLAAPFGAASPQACVGAAFLLCALVLRWPVGGVATLFAIALGAFFLGAGLWGIREQGPVLEGLVHVRGELTGVQGRRGLLELDPAPGSPAPGVVSLVGAVPLPPPGTRIAVQGLAGPIPRLDIPGAPPVSLPEGLSRAQSRVRIRQSLVLGSQPRAPPPFAGARHAGLLRALSTGDRSGVSQEERDLLRKTGTSHLLAISGLHVAMVASGAVAGCLLFSPFYKGLGFAGQRALLAVVGTLAALSYTALAGWPVSAVRASWMTLGGLWTAVLARGLRPGNLLALAALAVVLGEPARLGTAAFWLSFGAVVGMIGWVPVFRAWMPSGRWKFISGGLSVTLAALLGCLPVSAWLFQDLPLMAPVANLLAVPLVGFLCVPGALLGLIGIPYATEGADLGLGLLLGWLRLCVGPVFHPAVGPVGALGLLAVVLLPKHVGAAGVLLVLSLGLRLHPRDVLSATFLSVGQGNAALVELPEGQRVLVDGGPPSRQVLHWLRRRGISRLDEVVASHAHPDHVGGLQPVLESLEVAVLRLPRWPLAEETALLELVATARERSVSVRIGDNQAALFQVLHPSPGEAVEMDANDGSLVLRFAFGNTSLVLPGDIEARGEASLLKVAQGTRWLLAPHHGSRSSSMCALVEKWSASHVVMSAGEGNRFGHPAPEVMARYRGARVHRTDRHGTIQLVSNGTTERFRQWRRPGWSGWRDATGPPTPQSTRTRCTER
jgi:competence protein ComEC